MAVDGLRVESGQAQIAKTPGERPGKARKATDRRQLGKMAVFFGLEGGTGRDRLRSERACGGQAFGRERQRGEMGDQLRQAETMQPESRADLE